MPDTPSIVLVKTFTYRDAAEEYGNEYHFTGTQPANEAAWLALTNAMVINERPILPSTVTFLRAYGYNAGVDHSVATIDLTGQPLANRQGTGVFASSVRMPGDVAGCVRFKSTKRSLKGKQVYAYKYIHPAFSSDSDTDETNTAWKTALGVWAGKLIDGSLPGSAKYCLPQGEELSAPLVLNYLTTRTLKRRGKRPPTPP